MDWRIPVVGLALAFTACATDVSSSTTATTESQPGPVSTVRNGDTATTASFDGPGLLLVLGDWGAGTQGQVDVAGAMRKRAAGQDALAILTTGDNFYSDDSESLMRPFYWAVQGQTPFWIAWGNHDVESQSRIETVNSAFENPPRWQIIRWGLVDVIILDSNQVDSPEQQAFLTEAMSSDRPAVVAFHHPPYSCGFHGDTSRVLEEWIPLLDEDVVLVLSGHDHTYQRFVTEDITYIVTGGGGRRLYQVEACPSGHLELQIGLSAFNFLAVTQTDSGLDIEAIASDGSVIEEISIPFP